MKKGHVRETELVYETTIPTLAVDSVQIELADALTRYPLWPQPTVIVSDGPYGLGLFPGDPPTPDGLADWYAPHVSAWARYALPETTLWFWCNEVGWAYVHPVLEQSGWRYRSFHVWDKGIAHIAGNVNSNTIRRFPVVTEACVQYVREVELPTADGRMVSIRDWLRAEWERSGLPFSRTNEACGVKDAATRKYFTRDHLWYFPPPEMLVRLAAYAHKHGKATDRPYFSIDGRNALTSEQWAKLRSKWNYEHGVTNVWSEPAVRGTERLKNGFARYAHANQKPLRLIERIILASSEPGDVVWEPFGGLCSAAVASRRTGRRCYSAEISPEYYKIARKRLEQSEFLNMFPA